MPNVFTVFLSLVALSGKYGLRMNQINRIKQIRKQFLYFTFIYQNNNIINVNDVIGYRIMPMSANM